MLNRTEFVGTETFYDDQRLATAEAVKKNQGVEGATIYEAVINVEYNILNDVNL